MTETLLELDRVVRHFPVRGALGQRRGAVHAVDGVSLSVPKGQVLAVVGESGCGKSTLGRLMLRLLEPAQVAFAEAAGIATLGLAVNIASALILGKRHDHAHGHGHGHGHSHHAHAGGDGDGNLRAAHAHVLADALTSILAIAALLGARYFGWVWLDPAVGILGAVMIGHWAIALMRESAGVLLDRTDAGVAAEIRKRVETPGDARLVDLHVWRIGPDARAAIVSVAAPAGLGADTIRRRLAPVGALRHLTVEVHGLAR